MRYFYFSNMKDYQINICEITYFNRYKLKNIKKEIKNQSEVKPNSFESAKKLKSSVTD